MQKMRFGKKMLALCLAFVMAFGGLSLPAAANTDAEWDSAVPPGSTGIKKVTIKAGASGTLILHEPSVEIVIDDSATNDDNGEMHLVLESTVREITFSASTDSYPLQVDMDGKALLSMEFHSGDLALTYEGNLTLDSIDSKTGGSLTVDAYDASSNMEIGHFKGLYHDLTLNADVSILGLIGTVNGTLTADNGAFVNFSQNKYYGVDGSAYNPCIVSVRNIRVENGSWFRIQGYGGNIDINAAVPAAVSLMSDGSIIVDDASLVINGMNGDYTFNQIGGGTALQTNGSAEISVNNGGELQLIGGNTNNSTNGVAGSAINATAGKTTILLGKGSSAQLVGGYDRESQADAKAAAAVIGNVVTVFTSNEGEPALYLQNGAGQTQINTTTMEVSRTATGKFKITNPDSDGAQALSIQSGTEDGKSITILANTAANLSTGRPPKISLVPDLDKMYIYCGVTLSTPTAGEAISIGGTSVGSTNENGIVELSALSDGVHTILVNDVSITVTVVGGVFTNITPAVAGVLIAPNGKTLQCITAPQEDITVVSAVQYGGKDGVLDSVGVRVTFSMAVVAVPASILNISGFTFAAPTTTDNTTWDFAFVTAPGFNNQDSVSATFSGWLNYALVAGATQSVDLYKRGTPVKYTAVQVDGLSHLKTTTQIRVVFEQAVPDLTDAQILFSEAVVTNVEAVSASGDKEYIITITPKNFVANGRECPFALLDTDTLPIDPDSKAVVIYISNDASVTATASELGGQTDLKDSQILLTFDQAVASLTADSIAVTKISGGAAVAVDSVVQRGAVGTEWLVTLAHDDFADGDALKVVVADWSATEVNYRITNAAANDAITVYRDGRDVVTYTLAKDSNSLRTREITITFDAPVTGFTAESIKLTGGKVSDFSGSGSVYTVTLSAITAVASNNLAHISISIPDGDTYRLTDSGRTQSIEVVSTPVLTYVAKQIGGENQKKTTEYVELTFSGTVPAEITADEIEIRGGAVIDHIETNGRSVKIYLDSTTHSNNHTLFITMGGADGMIGAHEVFSGQTTLVVYRYYAPTCIISLEQIGGIGNGARRTQYIRVMMDGYIPNELVFESDDVEITHIKKQSAGCWDLYIPTEGAIPSTATIRFSGSFKGEPCVFTSNGSAVTSLAVELIDALPRTQYGAMQSGGISGWRDTTDIELTVLSTLSDLTMDDIQITGIDTDRLTLVKDPTDLTTWRIMLNDTEFDNEQRVTVKLADASLTRHYFWTSSGDNCVIGLYRDIRPIYTYTIAEKGGVSGSVRSKSLDAVFDADVPDPSAVCAEIYNHRTGKATTIYGIEDGDNNPKTVRFPLDILSYQNADRFDVSLTVSNSQPWKLESAQTMVTLYDVFLSAGSRGITEVAPRAIHKDSATRSITIVGNFGTYGADSIREVFIRKAGTTTILGTITLTPPEKPEAASGQHHSLTVDITAIDGTDDVGAYEIAYLATDGYLSPYAPFSVVDDPAYSTEANGYLTVTQKADQSFAVEFFSSEAEMKARKASGMTLLTIAGGILYHSNLGIYQVRGDSVFNKAVQFYAEPGEYLTLREVNGNVVLNAPAGTKLKWNSITIAKNGFDINLDQTKKYSNNRSTIISGTGGYSPVEIKSKASKNDIELLGFTAALSTYKLYSDSFSVAGQIDVGGAIPLLSGESGKASANINLEEMILGNTFSSLPPMKASGAIEIDPTKVMGDITSAAVTFETSFDTLPETSPKRFSAAGELDINEIIYLQGEFVFTWKEVNGRMYFVPDTLGLFVRSDLGGIPLVPPIVLATLKGAGVKVAGIGDTVFKNYKRVPPLDITISGAIEDITGMLDIEKVMLTFGTNKLEIRSGDIKLFHSLVTLKNCYAGFGVMDGPGTSVITYAQLGGAVSVLKELLQGKLDTRVEKQSQGGPLRFSLRAEARAKIQFLGATIAEAAGILAGTEKKISGTVEGKLWRWKASLHAAYNFEKKKFEDVGFSRNRMMMLAAALEESEDTQQLVVTNVNVLGRYAAPMARGRSLGAPAPVEIPMMSEGYIVAIRMNEKVDVIEVYQDGIYLEALHEVEWFETIEEEIAAGAGLFTAFYEIPADGNYVFSANTPLNCLVGEIVPVPALVSATYSGNTVTWTLNDAALADSSNLKVRVQLVSKAGDTSVATLTYAGADTFVDADTGSYTVTMPEALSSGEYFVSVELFAMETIDGELEETVYSVMDSDVFLFANPNAPAGVPSGIAITPIGNGSIKVDWAAVSGADGYTVTFLEEDEKGEYIPVSHMGAINTETNMIEVQGGLLQAEQETEDGTLFTTYGMEYGKEYFVQIQAFTQETIDDTMLNPVFGIAAVSGGFAIAEPQPPAITAEIANATVFTDEGLQWFGVNTYDTIDVILTTDSGADIIVKKPTEDGAGVAVASGDAYSFTPTVDGHYTFYLEAVNAAGDVGDSAVNILVDTEAPVIGLDQDSFFAIGGQLHMTGFTESTATLLINDMEAVREGTDFSFDAQVPQGVSLYTVQVTDRAGNVSHRYVSVINSDTEADNSPNPTAPPKASIITAKPIASTNNFVIKAPKGENVPQAEDGITTLTEGTQLSNRDMIIIINGTATLDNKGKVTVVEGTASCQIKASDAVLSLPVDTVLTSQGIITLPEDTGATVAFGGTQTLNLRAGIKLTVSSASPLGYTASISGQFSDVLPSDWYVNDIAFGYAHSFFTGYPGGVFKPQTPLTRGMFVTMLGNIIGVDVSSFTESSFEDVGASMYYAAFVEWARSSGITAGTGGNRFSPDQAIARQDLAVMLVRFAEVYGIALPAVREYTPFHDEAAISGYAYDTILHLYRAEIVSGKPGNLFDPKGQTTRAEFASILRRFFEALIK